MHGHTRAAVWALTWGLVVASASAEQAGAPSTDDSARCGQSILQRDSLTDEWFGFGRALGERGVSVGLSATAVFQANIHGGLSTHRRSGRAAGSYDLEVEADLDTLLHLPGGRLYLLAEGSWSDGIDPASVGSLFGVNADAGGGRSIDLTQLWYEQALTGEKLLLRVGKLDLTGGFECRGCPVAFDGSRYANDETAQFLNGALVNNPTIPFPDPGLGLVVYAAPVEWWYVAAGVADAQADARETGFNTAFHGPDYFFSIYETGFVPHLPSPAGALAGAYRVGFWYDPQPKDRLDGTGSRRDDIGLYVSCDQMLLRENRDDEQGLGVFARWGMADADVNAIRQFVSVGAQYQGLIPGRHEDVLGLGVARGWLSDDADPRTDREIVLELYYNVQVAPWLSITPDVQYVCSPAGDAGAGDAMVVGVRIQVSF